MKISSVLLAVSMCNFTINYARDDEIVRLICHIIRPLSTIRCSSNHFRETPERLFVKSTPTPCTYAHSKARPFAISLAPAKNVST
jgi:hypothetical protein